MPGYRPLQLGCHSDYCFSVSLSVASRSLSTIDVEPLMPWQQDATS